MKSHEFINESSKSIASGPLKGRGFQDGDRVITPDGRHAVVSDNSSSGVMINIDGTSDNVYIGNWQLTLEPEFEKELIAKNKEKANTNSNSGNHAPSPPKDFWAKSGKPHRDFGPSLSQLRNFPDKRY